MIIECSQSVHSIIHDNRMPRRGAFPLYMFTLLSQIHPPLNTITRYSYKVIIWLLVTR